MTLKAFWPKGYFKKISLIEKPERRERSQENHEEAIEEFRFREAAPNS